MTTADDVFAGRATWCVLEADNATVLPTFAAKSVDHVITDPPYEAEAHTLGRRLKTGAGEMVEAPLTFSAMTEAGRDAVALEIARLAARWVVVFCQTEATHKWATALHAGGAVTKRIGVWVKPDGQPQFSGDRPGCGFESIVFAHAKGRSKWNGGGRVAVFTHNKNTPGGKHYHETLKPLPLMLELVSLFTDPGDLVLDPFCGSGTTGVACMRLGRRFIGIERDAKYAQVARERLEAEGRGLTLSAARAGQTSIFDTMVKP